MASAPALADETGSTYAITVDGGVLPVSVIGQGFPVIFLHGWTLDHRMWQPQIAGLSPALRLILPDRRGFGGATAPPDLAREAADVLAIADALDLAQFGLVGLSQGAGVALDSALQHPDRIRALVLAGTPLPGLVPGSDAPPREDYAALVRKGAICEMRRQWMQHPLMHLANPSPSALLNQIVGDYEGRDLLAPSALPLFSADAIARLSMPVLALAGAHETPWRIACAQFLADNALRGRFERIAHAGHMINMEQPGTFNALLHDFLSPYFGAA